MLSQVWVWVILFVVFWCLEHMREVKKLLSKGAGQCVWGGVGFTALFKISRNFAEGASQWQPPSTAPLHLLGRKQTHAWFSGLQGQVAGILGFLFCSSHFFHGNKENDAGKGLREGTRYEFSEHQ